LSQRRKVHQFTAAALRAEQARQVAVDQRLVLDGPRPRLDRLGGPAQGGAAKHSSCECGWCSSMIEKLQSWRSRGRPERLITTERFP
jgi:hypothetical protein